jgi:hypothetical protein
LTVLTQLIERLVVYPSVLPYGFIAEEELSEACGLLADACENAPYFIEKNQDKIRAKIGHQPKSGNGYTDDVRTLNPKALPQESYNVAQKPHR